MKDKPIAFDDEELRNWLMDFIEEPENFLCAPAKAVVRANADNYGVVRPALVELKRRYSDEGPETDREDSSLLTVRVEPDEGPSH